MVDSPHADGIGIESRTERDALPKRFGVLTPASAMGDVLVSRLERADVPSLSSTV